VSIKLEHFAFETLLVSTHHSGKKRGLRPNPRHFVAAAAFASAEQFQAAAVRRQRSLTDGDSTASEIAPGHVTLEILAYGRQKPACSHFVVRILKKSLQSN